jgi:hypothetical protein
MDEVEFLDLFWTMPPKNRQKCVATADPQQQVSRFDFGIQLLIII